MNENSRLAAIEDRVRTILPPEYQDSYQDLLPAPMRSAGLRYNVDGKVAWDRIWGSFCDLAMAGGPPHKGTLLEPGRRSDIEAQPDRYDEVAEEICRGVRMAADLDAEPSPSPGWVRVLCSNHGMSGWLLRAIVMENVAVRSAKTGFDVPAAPHFRLEKEIKNVVTVVAKTSHYWMGHMPRSQQRTIANLFTTIAEESLLIEPLFEDTSSNAGETHGTAIAERIQQDTGLAPSSHRYIGWLGIECPSVRGAIWMMRAMVVSNVLSRREGTALFVPINPASDPEGTRVAGTFAMVWRLAAAKSVLGDIESAPAKSSGSG